MFRIHCVDHLVLRVNDLQAMLNFYQQVLGCTLEKVQEAIGLYQLRAGDQLIDLVYRPAEHTKPLTEGPTNMDHFCLRISPFDEAQLRQYFAGLGIECSEVAQRYGATGYGPSVYLQDPEGNSIELKAG